MSHTPSSDVLTSRQLAFIDIRQLDVQSGVNSSGPPSFSSQA